MKKIAADERRATRPVDPLRGKAGTCQRLALRLRGEMRGLDWDDMDAADRDGLRIALTELGGDIPLVWLIGSHVFPQENMENIGDTAKTKGTAKAAPAASPSRKGSESSDGDAALYD